MGKYNSNSFKECFINDKNIPDKNIIFYQVWINKFLSFYQKNLKMVKYDNIKAFFDKLESEGKEDRQIRQVYRAIKFFLKDFMRLTIDFRVYGMGTALLLTHGLQKPYGTDITTCDYSTRQAVTNTLIYPIFALENQFNPRNTMGMPVVKLIFLLELEEIFIP